MKTRNLLALAITGGIAVIAYDQFAISEPSPAGGAPHTSSNPSPAAPSIPATATPVPGPSVTPGPTGSQPAAAYLFRFATGLSKVMMDTVTFAQTQPLSLHNCQSTEKINGPIACAMSCDGMPICLMVFQGPAGLSSTDVLEKMKEEPMSGAAVGGGPSAPSVAPSAAAPAPVTPSAPSTDMRQVPEAERARAYERR